MALLMVAMMTRNALCARIREDDDANKDWCRLTSEVTRCVGTPLPIPDQDDWCPLEVCKPSYIRTEPCPADGTQVSTRCRLYQDSTEFWDCTAGAMYKRMYVPLGCEDSEDVDCYEITTCTCEKRVTERTKLKFAEARTPKCNNGRGSPRSGS